MKPNPSASFLLPLVQPLNKLNTRKLYDFKFGMCKVNLYKVFVRTQTNKTQF